MNLPGCEVIGCRRSADYVCICEAPGLEDYLCLLCYETLHKRHPDCADCYRSLSISLSLPATATDAVEKDEADDV